MTPELVQVERKWRVNFVASGCLVHTRGTTPTTKSVPLFISSIQVCGIHNVLEYVQKCLKFSKKIGLGMCENVVKDSATSCLTFLMKITIH